jgi:hypothetical protein
MSDLQILQNITLDTLSKNGSAKGNILNKGTHKKMLINAYLANAPMKDARIYAGLFFVFFHNDG